MKEKNIFMRWLTTGQVFLRLIERDLYVALPFLPNRIVSVVGLTVLTVYMYEYVGVAGTTGFGLFMAASEMGSRAFRRVFPSLRIVGDLLGDRSLFYYLTLPIPSTLVFLALALSSSIELMSLYIWVLPTAKLILGSSFKLSMIQIFKALSVFFCAHLFYGISVLLLASMPVRALDDVGFLHSRYSEPLFWIGGYYFMWHLLYIKSSWCAYFLFLNPLIYACEGMRSALLQDPHSLPVGWCCIALLMFTIVVGILAIWRMKKRID